ncbi:MAG TPA: mechanosensitive ion channel domain-containing protein [Myxococcota bacterium]
MTRSTTLLAFCILAVSSTFSARADVDAGVLVDVNDGGVVDGGVVDGGAVDGGVDAGVVIRDAGIELVDAGEAELVALLDGGPAHVVDAGPGEAKGDPVDIVARDAVSPLRYVRAEGKASVRARAALASRALAAAFDTIAASKHDDDDIAGASVRVEGEMVVARVGGVFVASFNAADVIADGGDTGDADDLASWAAVREPQLQAFVAAQQGRDRIRHTVTQVTLSIAILLLAFLLLRAQQRVFAGWQETLEQKGPLTAPVVLGVPLLSPDAARALLASGLQILRLLTMVGIVFAAVVTIGGQFERTRAQVDRLVDGLVSPVVGGAQAALRGVPGVLLAVVIGVVAIALWRFLRILLDGVAAGRVRSSFFQREQAPVARVVVGAVVVVIALLLGVAAFFLRFGTPVETLVLIAAAAIAAGTVPFFANTTAGLVVAWRQSFAVGDHIRVGTVHGEVARVRLHDVLLVPEEGGTITVPMLGLLVRPVQRLPSEPRAHVDTVVARDRDSAVVLDRLLALVRIIDERGRVEVLAASASTLTVRLIAGRGDGAEQTLWRALLKACDAGDVRLAAARSGRDDDERSGNVIRATDNTNTNTNGNGGAGA